MLQLIIMKEILGIPDTSIMLEGDKTYVYKVSEKNITNKTEIKIGIRIMVMLKLYLD